jgi:hypothetical protein
MKDDYNARCKTVRGWGLDFEFDEEVPLGPLPRVKAGSAGDTMEPGDPVETRMEDIVGKFVEGLERSGAGKGMGISATQQKKRDREEKKRIKVEKYKQSLVHSSNRQAP